ncbi:MAG: FKBP-type peptidyl-prolyl cis-trans isomerase [Nanoarchaeota archaeon]|nr:FKBP-type peptidyl-prolyl cis-trans isomerase [Nanoarchaeota archaeon]
MILQKNDFIEINFTGKTAEGIVFDSNISDDLKKTNLQDVEAKPFVYSIGQGMFLQGVDDFLIGKELGTYEIPLEAEKAFGLRDPSLIQIFPLKSFYDHKINPIQGAVFNFDGRLGKVLSNSGGRVRIDFNGPLAGKDVTYNVNVLRKVDDKNEQIKAFTQFLFKRDFDFQIKEDKIIFNIEKDFGNIIKLFEDKFKEIFNLGIEVNIINAEKNVEKIEQDISKEEN